MRQRFCVSPLGSAKDENMGNIKGDIEWLVANIKEILEVVRVSGC